MFGNNTDDHAQTNTDMDQVAAEIGQQQTGQSPQPAEVVFVLGHNPTSFTPVQTPEPTSPPETDDQQQPSPMSMPVTQPPATPASDLDSIKQQALQQLSPLVSKLDQSPEERFKTLMMLIQASDNHDMLQEAYDCANQLTDEKVKAEALLAIVNEINYFTREHAGN